jgi:ATP-dependent helicase/nuclease subunit A
MELTAEQKAIIAAPRGNLLVSAAAGSGKTAVLTERIVRRIIAGQLDVPNVLVMTFTVAAARQMKEKIAQKLQTALDEAGSPDARRRLARQLALLPGAAVSTIHAFCLDVIRNFYGYAVDPEGQPLVEPGFTVDDGSSSGLLLLQSLEEYLNGVYEQIDLAGGNPDPAAAEAEAAAVVAAAETAEAAAVAAETWPPERRAAFFRLADGYGGSRNDEAMRQQILSLHQYLRSLPDYPAFTRERLAELQAASACFSASPHCGELIRMLGLRLDRALAAVPEIEHLLVTNIKLASNAARSEEFRRQLTGACRIIRSLSGYLAGGGHDWEQIRALASGLAECGLPRAAQSDTPEKRRLLELFGQHLAEAIHFLTGNFGTKKYKDHFLFDTRPVFVRPAAAIEADIAAMLPVVSLLFELVLGLDQVYAARKRHAAMIDFADFEHLALAILRQPDVCRYYHNRFSEIYVDEYQDTSSIQEAIIAAVSSDNCLMVGDIKQSIYRFRHARPGIFLGKARAFQDGRGGQLYELNRNFRSVPGVLGAVNLVFRQLMSPGAGEIDYDERQALVPHRDALAGDVPVHLLLVNRHQELPAIAAGLAAVTAGDDSADDPAAATGEDGTAAEDDAAAEDASAAEEAREAEDLNRDEQESLVVIRSIRERREAGTPWRDMVILCRTRSIAAHYLDMLIRYGIPAWLQAEESFLEDPVMRQMEALIHLLDNGRQDIPLAAVMRASLFEGGFTVEEMARIRLADGAGRPRTEYFHESVRLYATHGQDEALRQKLGRFLGWLSELRAREQVWRLGELIGHIYTETGWLERLAESGDASAKIRRLRQFQQWAEQFERGRQRGLFAFARYLESLRETGPVEDPFSGDATDRDVVRIMTIHGSKGLEFGTVFLVGTGSGLQPKDSQDSVLISENLGLGMDYADPEAGIRYPSHLKLAMLEEIKAATLAEEMRLLYVAMTRAMDRLYIAGTVRLRPGSGDARLAGLLANVRQFAGEQLPAHLVLSAKNSLEWLLMALARQPGLDLDWLADSPAGTIKSGFAGWTLELHQLAELSRSLLPAAPASPAAASATETAPASPAAGERPAGSPTGVVMIAPASPDQRAEAPLEDTELERRLSRLVGEPYRFGQAAAIPAKVSVSELKRQGQIWSELLVDEGTAGVLDLRGISLSLHDLVLGETTADAVADTAELTGARLGTALHAVFRYLDLPRAIADPTSAEIERQVRAMRQHQMLTEEDLQAVLPLLPRLVEFTQSDLAREMAVALADPNGLLFREIPFTLAVPACEIYPSCEGLAPDDRILVQGMIDCWYEHEQGITLVDYKSDQLTADPAACQMELHKRYRLQLAYYARAIEAATGRPVRRRLIWLIRQSKAYDLSD